MVKLSKSVVNSANARDKRYVIFDEEIKGFGLRITPNGKKVWILEYRANGGGRKIGKSRFTIGSTSEFTPDQARKRADYLRSQVKLGGDPQAAKVEKRNAITVEELCQRYLKNHVETKLKENTIIAYHDTVRLHIIPAFGRKKADDLTRADVEQLHVKMIGKPIAANKMLAVLRAAMNYGFKMELTSKRDNPAADIDAYAENPVIRSLSVEEIRRLGDSLAEAETIGIPWSTDPEKQSKHLSKGIHRTKIDPYATAALRLLILTGARLREILHLTWERVDLERGVLKLGDSKTGPGEIVLNGAAIDVIRGLRRIGKFVIASESANEIDEKPRADLKRPWSRIKKHAGLSNVRLHDLRHTFASHGANGGADIVAVSKLLRHRNLSTTMRYVHIENDSLKKATESISSNMQLERN